MEDNMLEIANGSHERMTAALELLKLKAERMKRDTLHCFIDEKDVEEILFVAGFEDVELCDKEGLCEKEAPPC